MPTVPREQGLRDQVAALSPSADTAQGTGVDPCTAVERKARADDEALAGIVRQCTTPTRELLRRIVSANLISPEGVGEASRSPVPSLERLRESLHLPPPEFARSMVEALGSDTSLRGIPAFQNIIQNMARALLQRVDPPLLAVRGESQKTIFIDWNALIAQGGQGSVLPACHPDVPGEECVIKVSRHLTIEDSERHQTVERYRREGRILPALAGVRGVPQFVDAGEIHHHDGDGVDELPVRLFNVQKRIRGVSLRDLVQYGGALSPLAVRAIAYKGASVMAGVAQRGIVHRDLSPKNLMLDDRRDLYVIDFGYARSASDSAQRTVTRSQQLIGTAGYMAPEQADFSCLDERADIYVFHKVLYYLLRGEDLDDAESEMKTIRCFDPQGDSGPDEEVAYFRSLMRKLQPLWEMDGELAACLEMNLQRRLEGRCRSWEQLLHDGGTYVNPLRSPRPIRVQPLRALISDEELTKWPLPPSLEVGVVVEGKALHSQWGQNVEEAARNMHRALQETFGHAVSAVEVSRTAPLGPPRQSPRMVSRRWFIGGGITAAAAGALSYVLLSGDGDPAPTPVGGGKAPDSQKSPGNARGRSFERASEVTEEASKVVSVRYDMNGDTVRDIQRISIVVPDGRVDIPKANILRMFGEGGQRLTAFVYELDFETIRKAQVAMGATMPGRPQGSKSDWCLGFVGKGGGTVQRIPFLGHLCISPHGGVLWAGEAIPPDEISEGDYLSDFVRGHFDGSEQFVVVSEIPPNLSKYFVRNGNTIDPSDVIRPVFGPLWERANRVKRSA